MYTISEETLKNAYKPFDIVTDKDDNVGYIQETNINEYQPNPKDQVCYAIQWLFTKTSPRSAWWNHQELTKHGNLMLIFARNQCHNFGEGKRWVNKLLNL